MRKGQQLRVTEREGSIVTVESEGVVRGFRLEPVDDAHREHGGVDAGQMLTVREETEEDEVVPVDVWGCGCQFNLVRQPPI